MFTGIVESVGQVVSAEWEKSNLTLWIKSDFVAELKVDQSVSHNGVCLTVTALRDNLYSVTLIDETIKKTNFDKITAGDKVNLERCMKADGRFDGHIVQGHVDQVGLCKSVEDQKGSWKYTFTYDNSKGNFTVQKGSITVNGVSLTVVDSEDGLFSVAIIPYTHEHTNFRDLKENDTVNLEFDVLGKYLKKIYEMNHKKA